MTCNLYIVNSKLDAFYGVVVGLSNILDSELEWRKPEERPHGKAVGAAVATESKICYESLSFE